MKKTLAIILVLTLNFNIAKAQEAGFTGSDSSEPADNSEVSTIESALVETYNNNPEIRRARANLEAISELRSQALSGFLPTITANANYGHQKTEVSGQEFSGNSSSRSLIADQPIYRGGNFSRLDESSLKADAAMYDLKNAENEIFLSAISAYMNLVTDIAILQTAQNKEKFLYQHYDQVNKRFKAGELTRTDVSQSIARASVASTEVATAESNYTASRANFERVIGHVPGTLTIPAELPQIPQNIEEALNLAKKNNPAIKAAESNQLAAEETVEAQKGSLLPTLSVRGRLDRETNYALTNNGDYSNDSVTVNLSVPLYQAGSEYSRVRQAKAEASGRKYDYFTRLERVDADVKSAWRKVFTTSRSIDASQIAVRATEEALNGVKKEEALGTRTVIDVLDAEQELSAAKNRLLQERRDQIIAYYTLLARIGLLTAKDLQLPVKFYEPEKHYDKTKNKVIGF